MKRIDMAGQRFGKWVVVGFVRTVRRGRRGLATLWQCQCDCGATREVSGSDLRQGKTQSCGCTFNRDIDLAGQRFGSLTVLETVSDESWQRNRRKWRCRCDCGKETVTLTHYLTSGDTTSCGCVKRATAAKRCTTHGHAGRGPKGPEYQAWCGIIARCENPRTPNYRDYGGRGITVCAAWRQSFEQFLADVGLRPGKRFSLDRVDVNGNYEPGNVRWTTRKEQNNNTRRNTVLTLGDETLTISQWSDRLGISRGAVLARIAKGWPIEKALTTPRIHDRRGRVGPQMPERTVWYAMRYRCHNPADPGYPHYGGRGIKVCDRWCASFRDFYSDMGPRPTPKHRLERKDNDGDYCPENCVWATVQEQQNNRRSNVFLTYNGETKTVAQWSRDLGMPSAVIRARLKSGLTTQETLSRPYTSRKQPPLPQPSEQQQASPSG